MAVRPDLVGYIGANSRFWAKAQHGARAIDTITSKTSTEFFIRSSPLFNGDFPTWGAVDFPFGFLYRGEFADAVSGVGQECGSGLRNQLP
jgi:hypothetical protein